MPLTHRLGRLTFPIGFGMVLGTVIGYVVSQVDQAPWFYITLFSTLGGAILGLLIGLCEHYLVPGWGREGSFRSLSLKRFGYYVVSAFGMLLVVNVVRMSAIYDVPWHLAPWLYLSGPGARDMVIAVVASSMMTVVMSLSRLVTFREARDMLSGRYHMPRQEQRLFLFLDLKGSSAIAERLGPERYSRFVRDLFEDLDHAVRAWKGEVYQYLGDGAIISWRLQDQERADAGLRCFMEATEMLLARRGVYQVTHGCRPEWRGGLHAGEVVTTRVGTSRSSLAMHGDALNVAARLQGLCAEYETPLLVSRETLDRLDIPPGMAFDDRGEVGLKGRRKPVRIAAWKNPVDGMDVGI